MSNKIRKYGVKVNDKESELIYKFLPKLKVEYFGEETDVDIISFDIYDYQYRTNVLVGVRIRKHMVHSDNKRYKSGGYKSLGFVERACVKEDITESIISQIDMYLKLFASPKIFLIHIDKLSLE